MDGAGAVPARRAGPQLSGGHRPAAAHAAVRTHVLLRHLSVGRFPRRRGARPQLVQEGSIHFFEGSQHPEIHCFGCLRSVAHRWSEFLSDAASPLLCLRTYGAEPLRSRLPVVQQRVSRPQRAL